MGTKILAKIPKHKPSIYSDLHQNWTRIKKVTNKLAKYRATEALYPRIPYFEIHHIMYLNYSISMNVMQKHIFTNCSNKLKYFVG